MQDHPADRSKGLDPAARESETDFARLFPQFHLAFSLMSVIPLLICCYLIAAKFFSIDILTGLNGIYMLLAMIFAVLGLLRGRQLLRGIIQRLVETHRTLRRLHERQTAFMHHLAHEFRAPLAIVKGALDNLADGLHGALTQDQGEPVAMSKKEVDRLARLVGDLLDLARIESGKVELAQQDVILQDLLRSVTKLFETQAKERGLTLMLEVPEPPVMLIGDPDRLKQVFLNLVSNAVKFTKAGGIRVRLTRDDEAAQVEVLDTGAGIATGDLERIFEKFERVGSQTEEGSGLGLPIAKELVELHRGRVWAESEIGRGSRFIVRLPMNHHPDG